MEKQSLYRAAHDASHAFERTVAERNGTEVAAHATTEWNRDRWWHWAGERVVQHVNGDVFWIELGTAGFASVNRETPERMRMVEELVACMQRLDDGDLIPYAERERVEQRWAEIVNHLLD